MSSTNMLSERVLHDTLFAFIAAGILLVESDHLVLWGWLGSHNCTSISGCLSNGGSQKKSANVPQNPQISADLLRAMAHVAGAPLYLEAEWGPGWREGCVSEDIQHHTPHPKYPHNDRQQQQRTNKHIPHSFCQYWKAKFPAWPVSTCSLIPNPRLGPRTGRMEAAGGRQVGGCLPESAQFWAHNNHALACKVHRTKVFPVAGLLMAASAGPRGDTGCLGQQCNIHVQPSDAVSRCR